MADPLQLKAVAWQPAGALGVSIHQQIQDQVAKALGDIPPGRSTIAAVSVTTGAGINLAIAHKVDDKWKVAAWVGKSGWDKPIEGGASITFTQ